MPDAATQLAEAMKASAAGMRTRAAEAVPATQAAPTGRVDTDELGGTGLKGAEPYGGWVYEEFLPKLRGAQAARTYKEMADNDAMCGAGLFALESLIRNVPWRVEPADDSSEAEEAKTFVEQVLFQDMVHPFGQLIDEACSMLTYGYSPHEIVWKVRNGYKRDPSKSSQFADGRIGIASLPVRSQEFIWRWLFDTEGRGNIIGLEQMRLSRPNALIPIEKMLLFRTKSQRNNPEGRSVLRNAYVPYLRKKVLEEAEGKLALRSAGIVMVRIPAKFMDSSAGTAEKKIYESYKSLADKIAQDRQGSIVLPSDKDEKGNVLYDMSYVTADSRNTKDLSPVIERYDMRIAVSMLADFLLLGTKNVGSWALADQKVTLFEVATEGYLGQIAEQFNRVLLTKLWLLNGLPMETKPKMMPGQVQRPDLERIGNYILNLSKAGMPLFPSEGENLEQHLLSLGQLPTKTEQG